MLYVGTAQSELTHSSGPGLHSLTAAQPERALGTLGPRFV